MKRMYEVIYKTYVIADDHEEAENIARDIKFTIQDSSVRADLIKPVVDPKIVKAVVNLSYNLFQLPGMDSKKARNIIQSSLNDLDRKLSNEELDTLYEYCEKVYLYDVGDNL